MSSKYNKIENKHIKLINYKHYTGVQSSCSIYIEMNEGHREGYLKVS